MHFSSYTVKTAKDTLNDLGATRSGLTNQEVIKRQEKFGINQVSGKETHWWEILTRQFKSPFIFLLIGATLLSFFLQEIIDGYMILLFVGINTFLGFYQEYRSEKTLQLLRQYIVAKTRVFRSGEEATVLSSDLVPGDIVLLEAGDIVPADLRLIEEENIFVDESILTGESMVVKKTNESLKREVSEIYKAQNICFLGTTISSGKGVGVVINTGKNTVIGEITSLTIETKHESSFEKSIAKFSKFTLQLVVATLIFISLTNIAIKGSNVDIPTFVIFAIALSVSVIPEALPVVMTFSLSRGALHLAKHKVVVKRLSAIEDLGSIEVLCTDKTGTITENILTVDAVYPKNCKSIFYASLAKSMLSKTTRAKEPFDSALISALEDEDKKLLQVYSQLKEIPFTPQRRRNSVVVKINNTYELIVRGATETILQLCEIGSDEKRKILTFAKNEGEEGRRVIAVARKTIKREDIDINNLQEEENSLTFVGVVSFVDPIKKTANASIAKAKSLGLIVKILTGDSKEVAGSVAQKIGLVGRLSDVITGEEFDALPILKQHEAVEQYSVFARVSPEQKHKIVQILRERHEVGYLGEGINDAPALKAANVAMVVQGAADIARETADIVLLNKSLNVIVDGIKEGREIFANTSKYIKATLASNFGNFYTVAIASLFINFLPLLPLQILLINLFTDFPMIAVATDNVDGEELRSPRSYNVGEIVLLSTIMGVVSSVFDFIFFVLFYRISPEVLQTNWFIGSVLTELVFLFSIRTRFFVFKAKAPSSILLYLSLIAFVTAIAIPFTGLGQIIFKFVTPSITHLFVILIIVFLYFISTESVKLMYYRFVNSKEKILG